MNIHCTKKLLDQLKIKPEQINEEKPLIGWHANLITVNRRKTVVLVNDKNRYVIVLHGLKAKDFNSIDKHIRQAIRITFAEESIRDEVIEQFMQSADAISYTKTTSRELIARMNKACETLSFFQEMLDPDTIYQPAISRRLSRFIVGGGKSHFFHPNEKMYEDLKQIASLPIFQTKALELKITMRLDNFNVFRRIIVPVNITFNKLHEVIQIAFGWQDYHLYEYYIFEDIKTNQPFSPNHPAYDGEGYKPIMNLVCNQEALNYGDDDIPVKMDTNVKLYTHMPAKVTYVYDLGDNWVHDIKVERVINDYDNNYPICLEGKGNTPPEDVGGEGGYEEFLKIITDKSHPDYKNMKLWSVEQGYEDFNIEQVNKRLKKI